MAAGHLYRDSELPTNALAFLSTSGAAGPGKTGTLAYQNDRRRSFSMDTYVSTSCVNAPSPTVGVKLPESGQGVCHPYHCSVERPTQPSSWPQWVVRLLQSTFSRVLVFMGFLAGLWFYVLCFLITGWLGFCTLLLSFLCCIKFDLTMNALLRILHRYTTSDPRTVRRKPKDR